MTIIFRARSDLMRRVRKDLHRPHAFAAERIGFFLCRAGSLDDGGLTILAADYAPVEDDDYLDDPTVGAMMGPAAIRKALQRAYNGGSGNVGLFHVHVHHHYGKPGLSRVDATESRRFVPDFFNAAPAMPHGTVVLSLDRAVGLCWTTRQSRPAPIERFAVVGAPLQLGYDKCVSA